MYVPQQAEVMLSAVFFMIIKIKLGARRLDEKELFVKRVVERLAESPGVVRREDIFFDSR